MTDGIYQSAFVTTGKGVILFDAPESFTQHIVKAVADVTQEPIVQLVYSHAHVDHIAGASLLVKQLPNLTHRPDEGDVGGRSPTRRCERSQTESLRAEFHRSACAPSTSTMCGKRTP